MKRFKTVTHPITGKKIPEFLTGVITPMFTPCLPDLSLDVQGFRNMVEFFVKTKSVRSLFPRCGLGRMYTFTPDDVRTAIDAISSQNAGRLYFLPGTAGYYSNNPNEKPDPEVYIQQSLDLSLYAQEKGADAVVLVVPSALPIPSGGSASDVIYNYYAKMNDALDLPIVVYHPGRLEEAYNFTPEIIARVSALDKVVGMKFSSVDLSDYTDLTIGIGDNDFSLFAGSESVYLYSMLVGGLGVIGQGADNIPEILNALYKYFMAGDYKNAREAQLDVNRTLLCAKEANMGLVGLHYLKHRGVELSTIARGGAPETAARIKQITEDTDRILAKYTD
ncbi:dihydrodipicolinate synthase family protein [candidate division KSB1 bacterium]|nr:dihydrodipicolinate synthase family protein [candidate division KSB1 bacterium]